MGCLWLLTICVLRYASASNPEVLLAQGKAVGKYQQTINGRTISSFVNLPYAKPPVGELRLKDPEPALPWEGTLKANEDIPKICLQSKPEDNDHSSEDCLYLNVYTPNVHGEKLLDVLFVIHGGSFQGGFGRLLGPEYLLDEENVVMVTINYRLGVLGFLSLEDDVIPGNFGLKDQLLALKWTRDNIFNFGGDPEKITLVGSSAGGVSVHLHMLSEQSRGLFQKAIALSGVSLNPWAISRNPKDKAIRIAQALQCPTSTALEIAECLRTKPAKLLASQAKLFNKYIINHGMYFNPVIEKSSNGFLTKSPREIIKSKDAADVPFLLSYMNDDGLMFSAKIFTNPIEVEELVKEWDDLLPTIFDYDVDDEDKHRVGLAIKDFYLKHKHVADAEGLTRLFTERLLASGIRETAKLHASFYESPVYAYVLSHAGNKRYSDVFNHRHIYHGGAVHADDFAYVVALKGLYKRDGDPKEEAVSKLLIKLWMDFVNGKPSSDWAPVDKGLPDFGYFHVAGPDPAQNGYEKLNDLETENFWRALPLRENGYQSGNNAYARQKAVCDYFLLIYLLLMFIR